jgi:hypothetical protein
MLGGLQIVNEPVLAGDTCLLGASVAKDIIS